MRGEFYSMSENRGRYLAELRRSNAAGIHGHDIPRSQARRLAIMEELDMPITFIDDYREEEYIPEGDSGLDFVEGPTDEELALLEQELAGDSDLVDLDDEGYVYPDPDDDF
jgi:hypothetical protein